MFLPLKEGYRLALKEISIINDTALANKQRFINCYIKARYVSLTLRNIKLAFKVIGIYPINRQKLLSSTFVISNNSTEIIPSTP